jgi:hypothetical protein
MTITEQLLQNANAYAEGFDKGDLPLPPAPASASPCSPAWTRASTPTGSSGWPRGTPT